jgi:hypothetical protein
MPFHFSWLTVILWTVDLKLLLNDHLIATSRSTIRMIRFENRIILKDTGSSL